MARGLEQATTGRWLRPRIYAESPKLLAASPRYQCEKNKGLSAVAEELYKERLHAAFGHITKASTVDKYTVAVDKLGSVLRMPWMVHTKVRPHRFRSF